LQEVEALTSLSSNGRGSEKLWSTLAKVDAALGGEAGGQLDRIDLLERLIGKLQANQLIALKKRQAAKLQVIL
jgi:hypothetical protein